MDRVVREKRCEEVMGGAAVREERCEKVMDEG